MPTPLPPGAKASEGIAAMKGKLMAGMNAYIAAHNLRNDDGGWMMGRRESRLAGSFQRIDCGHGTQQPRAACACVGVLWGQCAF
jgi:hypothetical protein